MNTSVDRYFIDGCMRCDLGETPECKVQSWKEPLLYLRNILQETNLQEECKWGVPCYSLGGKNVIIISAFKQYCCISFFKGALIKDDHGFLEKSGPNSYGAGRIMKLISIVEIKEREHVVLDYIHQAIEIEQSGKTYIPEKPPQDIPEELQEFFDNDPAFRSAFESLTPGRQRGYLIFFSAPKQSKTRIARIEKCLDKIMNGIGLHDHYKRGR